MLFYHLSLISLALWFPAQIAADCAGCDAYTGALKSCQKGSANITQVGSAIDTDVAHCMCVTSSSHADMNSCTGCLETDDNLAESIDITILTAWTTACNADDLFGDKQAALCWQGQPTNYVPCVSKTGGNTGSGPGGSGGSGTLSGGSSSSSGTTLPQSTSASPKSAGHLSFSMSIPLSIVLIAFGMLIGL